MWLAAAFALGAFIGGLLGHFHGFRVGVSSTIISVISILPKDQARDIAKVFKYHMEKGQNTGVGSDPNALGEGS